MRKVKANGQRGSWFAEVGGEALPCVHKFWWKGKGYHDPNARPGEPKWDQLIGALLSKQRVVLTDDNVTGDGLAFERKGYIAVYEIANVRIDGSDLRFDFVRRLCDLS